MYKNFVKRCLDIILALIILPVLLVVIAIFGPIIYLTDKGPIFYNAERVGKSGNLFKMYKFRSMIVNAPDIRLEDGSTYNGEDDSRVTKIGKFLRKTSLDELPQILNVLKGEMSFIGPRPDTPDWLDKYTDEEKIFLTVKPGITGYSQAYFRNSVNSREKIKNDVYYALNYSFLLDLKIILKTIQVVLKSDNVYRTLEDEVNN